MMTELEPSDGQPPLPLVAALTYARRGWRVVPILPGTKHPGVDEWQRIATTDTAKIRHWWANRPNHGVGIVTGVESGIFVIDVDVSDGKHGDDTVADLEAEHGSLPHTVESVTGTGGRHIYLRMPEGLVVTNAHAALLGPHVDIRGEGGQVLAPPTIHPVTGTAYAWEEACHPARIPVADAPAWMVALFSAPAPTRERRPSPSTTGRPGDVWAAQTDWADLIEPDGARIIATRTDRTTGQTYELVARPGVDHTSGTIGYKGSDVLKVFTSEWKVTDPATGEVTYLTQDATYTKLGYLAATRFGGDHSAAASWLAKQGYTGEDDLDSMVDKSAPARDVRDPPENEPWPDPVPIIRRVELPTFPVDALPETVALHCLAVALQLQVPVDLCCQQAIAVLAAVLGGRREVTPWAGWSEPLNLFLVTALASGAGKSPADRWIAGPLRELELDLAKAGEIEHRQALLRRQKAEQEHKTKHTMWLTGGGGVTDLDMFEAEQKLAEAEVPPLPRLLADDATPEALTAVLAEQGGRLAVVSTEAALLDIVCGTYADRGKTPNLDVYLKGWEGGALRVDRKGSAPIHVARATITVGITVQPVALENVKGQRVLGDRGFFPRFMFSLPADIRGWRDVQQMRSGAAALSLPAWQELVDRVYSWAAADTRPLSFSIEAQELLERWLAEVEERRRPGGDLYAVIAWSSKMTASVVRLAGILHAAERLNSHEEIPTGTLRRAIRIGDYWTAHAHAVDALTTTDVLEEQAQAIVQALIKKGDETVTVRDLHRLTQRVFKSAKDMIEPLELLAYNGWVRPAPGDNLDNIGRRGVTTALRVRPNLQYEWTKDTQVKRVVTHVTVSQLMDLDLDSHPSSPESQTPHDTVTWVTTTEEDRSQHGGPPDPGPDEEADAWYAAPVTPKET